MWWHTRRNVYTFSVPIILILMILIILGALLVNLMAR